MFKRSLLVLFLVCFIFKIDAQVQRNDTVAVKAVNDAIQKSTKTLDAELPVITYTFDSKKYEIAEISVSGLINSMYEDYVLIGLSGLSVGDVIEIPGAEITKAVKNFWKNGLFSDVKIEATKISGNKIWLKLNLKDRPRISDVTFSGVKKGEREDLEKKIGVVKGGQINPNIVDRYKIYIKKYFDEKGFNNAVIDIAQVEDLSKENQVILNIKVDKKEKVKVNNLVIDGNKLVSVTVLEKAMKKTRHKHTLSAKARNFLRNTNYVPENYQDDKSNLIAKYNELGYRDARIMSDSVYRFNDKKVNIDLNVEEGQQYFLRKIDWVGNAEFATDKLNMVLGMKAGDVYNQKKLEDNLVRSEEAVGNVFYSNNGYLFYQIDPVEVNIEKDSVDLEIRVMEGKKATIRKVTISGNDRLYEDVVRRELRTKPGALFSREDLMRSLREVAQMGHFDAEKLQNPEIEPDREQGVVDIGYPLVSKANDQVEFSAGWGQTGILGRLSLKFTNFSLKNLLNPGSYKGIIPQGEGQTLQLSGQTNGKYYQSYSLSFSDPWFGGKRPNYFSVGAYYSKQTGVNSDYYSQSMSSLYNSSYYSGSGTNSGYGDYMYNSALDESKSMQMYGVSVAYGKRLNWPDDYFQAQAELSYQIYEMKNWDYFLITNGKSNNLSLRLTLMRNSMDQPIYTRRGSEFSLSVQMTPPYSAWDKTGTSATDADNVRYKWVEYHKWKFKSRTFTPLIPSIQKTPVLMTRAEYGMVGYYNKNKKSPFETFYVGGDGMTGYSSGYATETIGLRGYENGSLGYMSPAYARLGLELRYPLILEPTSTIYLLSFVEAGNAWSNIKDFNPFELKRSAGVGARVMLPMIGLLGIDWAYGFDKVPGASQISGAQFHFIIGQEF